MSPTIAFIPGDERIRLGYSDYAAAMRDGDLLLWTPRSFYGRAIARYTGGPFCHVTAVVSWNTRPMSVGYDETRGGVAMPLEAQVLQCPGDIHVYRVRDLTDADRVVLAGAMLDSIGWRYRWGSIRLLTLVYLPLLRLFTFTSFYARLVKAASASTREGICSQFIAREFAKRGHKFVNKQFAATTPNDIGQSGVVDYVGTLWPCADTCAIARQKSEQNKLTVSEGTLGRKLSEFSAALVDGLRPGSTFTLQAKESAVRH